jgi:tetratricopeptide (TPR) repeat protein
MVTIRSGKSPAVRVQEIDLSDHVSNQVNTVSMLIGVAERGPAFKIDIVNSEREFVETYGEPSSDTAKTFFAASGYFARGANLLFTRVVDRPRAVVAAIGFDANSDNEPNGSLPSIANLDPYIYNNDPTEYIETQDENTIVSQSDIDDYYNTDYKCTQAFYTRHTLNRAYPRERQKEYEVGDLVHDGWYESTELGQVEHFSSETAPGVADPLFPNGYVYRCITAGLVGNAWNNAAERTDKGSPSDDIVVWDTDVGDTTTDGEVVWQRVAWVEETWVGGIRYKHGPTTDPEYYDPDDTSTFDFNVTINEETKQEDLVISAIGPGDDYNDYYIFLLGYQDAEKLKQYPYSLTIPRETLKSDSFVPEAFANWGTSTSPSVKRVLSKVKYSELVNKFDFLGLIPENLPKSTDEFGLFVLTYDSISDSWSESEYHRVSTDENSFDENGNKLFIEEVVNNKSKLIRTKLNTTGIDAVFTTTLPIPLKGGYSGQVQNFFETTEREGQTVSLLGEFIEACDIYRESDVDIDVLIEGDNTLGAKIALANLAEDIGSGEAIAVLDVPYEYADLDQIISWTQENLLLGGTTGSYAALYHNRLKIFDKYNGIYRWVAPSGTLAGIYAAQHDYKKAIRIYQKLILKFPDKMSYFARLIEELRGKV